MPRFLNDLVVSISLLVSDLSHGTGPGVHQHKPNYETGRQGSKKRTHAQSHYHDVEMRGQFHRNGYLSCRPAYRPPSQNTRCATGLCYQYVMTRHLLIKNGSQVRTHPGLPFPHGLSQLGSPGLDAFHKAKSLHHSGMSILLGRILGLEDMFGSKTRISVGVHVF